jgi:hypothetical protein
MEALVPCLPMRLPGKAWSGNFPMIGPQSSHKGYCTDWPLYARSLRLLRNTSCAVGWSDSDL